MARLRNLCCYCASSDRVARSHLDAASALGREAAARGVGIVYGAGSVGLMGELARAAMAAGGRVIGIIPELIEAWEVGLKEVDEYIVVDSMHTRKALMVERADAFCALPGGIGTLDELLEAITWRELGIHDKPIVLLDNDDFWQPLIALLEQLREGGFLRSPVHELFSIASTPAQVFDLIDQAPDPREPDHVERL